MFPHTVHRSVSEGWTVHRYGSTRTAITVLLNSTRNSFIWQVLYSHRKNRQHCRFSRLTKLQNRLYWKYKECYRWTVSPQLSSKRWAGSLGRAAHLFIYIYTQRKLLGFLIASATLSVKWAVNIALWLLFKQKNVCAFVNCGIQNTCHFIQICCWKSSCIMLYSIHTIYTLFQKNVHTYNFKKFSKHRHCRDIKHCFVDSLPYALSTIWGDA